MIYEDGSMNTERLRNGGAGGLSGEEQYRVFRHGVDNNRLDNELITSDCTKSTDVSTTDHIKHACSFDMHDTFQMIYYDTHPDIMVTVGRKQ